MTLEDCWGGGITTTASAELRVVSKVDVLGDVVLEVR
jgi:hypothetical protein